MNPTDNNQITVRDIDIPFSRMVVIILKFMLASIPAVILMYIIFGIIFFAIAMVFGGGAALFENFQ